MSVARWCPHHRPCTESASSVRSRCRAGSLHLCVFACSPTTPTRVLMKENAARAESISRPYYSQLRDRRRSRFQCRCVPDRHDTLLLRRFIAPIWESTARVYSSRHDMQGGFSTTFVVNARRRSNRQTRCKRHYRAHHVRRQSSDAFDATAQVLVALIARAWAPTSRSAYPSP